MSRADRPLLILSDVHLGKAGPKGPAADLARLLAESPDHELVLAGDVFDLSVDPPDRAAADSVVELLKLRPELCAALGAHLNRGSPVTLVAGNHDAAITAEPVRQALLSLFGVSGAAKLSLAPWFVRRGDIHIEHGHLFDPDNAPSHPLAPWSARTEPLGVALTRRFLAPTGALQFAHAHETTPLSGLMRAFAEFGVRTPWVILRYFSTAGKLCLEAGRQPGLASEREQGRLLLGAFSELAGLEAEVLQRLSEFGAQPTHHRFRDIFMRLYFDRVLAGLGLASGAIAAAAVGSAAGTGVAALSLGYLAASTAVNGTNRYSGRPEQRLRDAAARIREVSGASVVIFGHTHREDETPGYFNSGSFVYSRKDGRPHLVVAEDGVVSRRVMPAGG